MSTEAHRFEYRDKNGNRVYDKNGEVRTYPVYHNDIRCWRQWKNDSKESKKLKFIKRYDTIEARIEECIKSKWESLNLNDMDLKEFPLKYIKHPERLQHIFCSRNCFKELPNLNKFTSLKVLDLSHNKLKYLPKLPDLEELCFANNLISDTSNLPLNLLRMDCSNNSIRKLPKMDRLTHLNCHKNKLKELPKMDSITELICHDNRLKTINSYHKMTYLDCSNNNVSKIEDQKLLEELCCDRNPIRDIPCFMKLNFLLSYDTEIANLWYMPKLKFAVMDSRYLKAIHEYYEPNITQNKTKHILQIELKHKKIKH